MSDTTLRRRTVLQGIGAIAAAGLGIEQASAQQVLWSSGTEPAKLKMPADACDCHHHIYDGRFPIAPSATLKPGDAKAIDAKPDPEQSSWREQVGKARTRAKELERAAEEAELRITTLRNELGVSGESARHRNEMSKPFPFFPQLDAMDCGPASLRMIWLNSSSTAGRKDSQKRQIPSRPKKEKRTRSTIALNSRRSTRLLRPRNVEFYCTKTGSAI